MMKRILIRHFRYDLIQFGFGRRWIGGKFWHVWPEGMAMGSFWTDTLLGIEDYYILKTEEYEKSKKEEQGY